MGRPKWVQGLGLVLGIVVVMLVVPSIALAAGDANEAQCAAKTEASPGFRSYLPDCRAYELVTPPYKEGGIVLDEPGAVSANGSRVIVGSGGAFSGAGNYWFSPARNPNATAYELERGAGGWQSSALTPPASEYSHSALMAVSSDFEATLWGAEKTVPPGAEPALHYHESIYLRTGPSASNFNLVGPGTPLNGNEEIGESDEELNLVGASRDLSHSLFTIKSSELPNGHSDLWVGDTTILGKGSAAPGRESLYEYVYTETEDSEPVLVGVKNNGPLAGGGHINEGAELISNCGTTLGSKELEPAADHQGSVYNAVSSSGEDVFFTAFACAGGPKPVNFMRGSMVNIQWRSLSRCCLVALSGNAQAPNRVMAR